MRAGLLARVKDWAKRVKSELVALAIAARDPRTPALAKIVAGATVAYALSPVDLVPDFIPVLGYLDDVILVPLGLWLAMRLVPDEVLADARRSAGEVERLPASRAAGAVIALIWVASAAALAWWLM